MYRRYRFTDCVDLRLREDVLDVRLFMNSDPLTDLEMFRIKLCMQLKCAWSCMASTALTHNINIETEINAL